MKHDLIIYSVLAIGMVCLWLYHRKPKAGKSKRSHSFFMILIGIIFVMGFLYILKEAEMLPT